MTYDGKEKVARISGQHLVSKFRILAGKKLRVPAASGTVALQSQSKLWSSLA
jgi:hypothetical protein